MPPYNKPEELGMKKPAFAGCSFQLPVGFRLAVTLRFDLCRTMPWPLIISTLRSGRTTRTLSNELLNLLT